MRPSTTDTRQRCTDVLLITDSEMVQHELERRALSCSALAVRSTTVDAAGRCKPADLAVLCFVGQPMVVHAAAVRESGAILEFRGEDVARIANAVHVSVRCSKSDVELMFALIAETARRLEAERRIETLQVSNARQEHHAALGRYMLESRHSINNILTSLIGNIELLQLREVILDDESKEEVNTIHSSALRLNETMQRLASLEAEMQIEDLMSQDETTSAARVGLLRQHAVGGNR